MTLDHAVALSLLDDQLPKPGLTARLLSDDPELLELAALRLDDAREARRRAEKAGIHALPWSDPAFPSLLAAISDCPPVLWYRGRSHVARRPDDRDRRIARSDARSRWTPRRDWPPTWRRAA